MTASTGYGSTFRLGDGAGSEAFTTLGEVVSITPTGKSRDAVETTHMTSPNRFRTYTGGMRDGGEYEVTLNYDPGDATAEVIDDAYNDNDTRGWRDQYPDGSRDQGQGLITNVKPAKPMDDRMVITFTLKVSGEPEFVPA